MKKLSVIIIALLCLALLVACGPKTNEGLENASTYLHNLYKDEAEVTPADYQLVGKIIIEGVTYTVTWTTDSDKVKVEDLGNGFVKIDVDEESLEEVSYKLTATIADAEGATTTREYNRKVPKFDITDWDEYMAAKEGDTLVVQGIVVGINSKAAGNTRNHLFLMDATGKGGYYSYQMEADPVADLGIEVGMTVRVAGPAAPYSGMMEIKGGTATIVDSNVKTFDYVDITDKFVTGTDFNQFVALPVIIKGVTIGNQELEVANSQYLNFELNGVKSYVRTYVTDFPTNLKAEDKATIDADHAAHFGYKADVAGILVTYSGTPYLIPTSVTPFTNYQEVQKTPAEKVAAEKDALNIGASFNTDTVIDLLATGKYYDDVVITWATDNTTNAAIADGKLNIVVPEEAVKVTITATITCGDVTETKTFEIALSKAPITIPEALALPDGANVLVSGTVVEINTEWSDQYNNITVTIADAEGNKLYVYRLATKVVVGDIITVKGQMGSYKGSKQVAQGATATIDDPAPVEVTLTEAVALEDGVRVIVKGTVKEINTEWSEQYGNITVTIEDATGATLYIYRLATNVKVGDVVTITGKVGSYKGSKQIAQGATAVIEGAGETGGETGGETTTPADGTKVTVSIADFAAANSWADATPYTEFKLNDDITVTATGTPVGDYGLNTGKYYASSNTWRIYQNESPAFTIKVAEGKTIATVKITYSTKNDGVLTMGETQVASETVVTVNANSVTFSVGNTGTKTNGQAQITGIEIIYN